MGLRGCVTVMPEKSIYRVVFFNQGKVYEVYANAKNQHLYR